MVPHHRRMRILLPCLFLMCCAGLGFSATQDDAAKPDKLPGAAQTIIDRLTRADDKLTEEYAKNRAAERTKAITDLQKVLKDTTKTGDLDAANAVKARIDDLKAQNAKDDDTDMLGDKKAAAQDPRKAMAGVWTFEETNGNSGTFDFSSDGTLQVRFGLMNVPGRWDVLEKDKLINIVLVGDPARWVKFPLPVADKMTGDIFDAGKGGIKITRVPAKK